MESEWRVEVAPPSSPRGFDSRAPNACGPQYGTIRPQCGTFRTNTNKTHKRENEVPLQNHGGNYDPVTLVQKINK